MWIIRNFESESGYLKKESKFTYGPRRVGKTALIEKLLEDKKGDFYW